jgi:hypothetical protein
MGTKASVEVEQLGLYCPDFNHTDDHFNSKKSADAGMYTQTDRTTYPLLREVSDTVDSTEDLDRVPLKLETSLTEVPVPEYEEANEVVVSFNASVLPLHEAVMVTKTYDSRAISSEIKEDADLDNAGLATPSAYLSLLPIRERSTMESYSESDSKLSVSSSDDLMPVVSHLVVSDAIAKGSRKKSEPKKSATVTPDIVVRDEVMLPDVLKSPLCEEVSMEVHGLGAPMDEAPTLNNYVSIPSAPVEEPVKCSSTASLNENIEPEAVSVSNVDADSVEN